MVAGGRRVHWWPSQWGEMPRRGRGGRCPRHATRLCTGQLRTQSNATRGTGCRTLQRLGLRPRAGSGARAGRDERFARLTELFPLLAARADQLAHTLSGGERRRLEITRALVSEPKFMLLDEPFAGVDPIAVHDIQQIVAGLRHRGIGVVITDHNVEQTLDIVDRAYIMYEGRVRVSGTVAELVWNDEVAEIYFGPTLTARMRDRYARPVVA